MRIPPSTVPRTSGHVLTMTVPAYPRFPATHAACPTARTKSVPATPPNGAKLLRRVGSSALPGQARFGGNRELVRRARPVLRSVRDAHHIYPGLGGHRARAARRRSGDAPGPVSTDRDVGERGVRTTHWASQPTTAVSSAHASHFVNSPAVEGGGPLEAVGSSADGRTKREGPPREARGGPHQPARISRNGRRCSPPWPSGWGWRRSSPCRPPRSGGPAGRHRAG